MVGEEPAENAPREQEQAVEMTECRPSLEVAVGGRGTEEGEPQSATEADDGEVGGAKESAPPMSPDSPLDLSVIATATRPLEPESESQCLVSVNIDDPIDDPDAALPGAACQSGLFRDSLEQIMTSLRNNHYPDLNGAGSSGSYLCRNMEGRIQAVFKPKNEEPYGDLNPKWQKAVQRVLCRCCFGRNCLLSNQGYISEAAASAMCRHLGWEIVPETHIITLASPTFYYPAAFLRASRGAGTLSPRAVIGAMSPGGRELPGKIGSLQMFMHDHKSAKEALPLIFSDRCTKEAKLSFQRQFEQVVIVDYIARNTDTHSDNWLIYLQFEDDNPHSGKILDVHIACIDNGLSFPFKHPDHVRAYPFQWAKYPFAKTPFTEEVRREVVPMLDSSDWRSDLIAILREIMEQDSNFNAELFQDQMAVVEGQIYNLRQSLGQPGSTPAELAAVAPVVVQRESLHPGKIPRGRVDTTRLLLKARRPCFASC